MLHRYVPRPVLDHTRDSRDENQGSERQQDDRNFGGVCNQILARFRLSTHEASQTDNIRTVVQTKDRPDHNGSLKEQLRPHKRLEERRRVDEELVVIGGNVEGLEAFHEAGDHRGWVDCLEVHHCHVNS